MCFLTQRGISIIAVLTNFTTTDTYSVVPNTMVTFFYCECGIFRKGRGGYENGVVTVGVFGIVDVVAVRKILMCVIRGEASPTIRSIFKSACYNNSISEFKNGGSPKLYFTYCGTLYSRCATTT